MSQRIMLFALFFSFIGGCTGLSEVEQERIAAHKLFYNNLRPYVSGIWGLRMNYEDNIHSVAPKDFGYIILFHDINNHVLKGKAVFFKNKLVEIQTIDYTRDGHTIKRERNISGEVYIPDAYINIIGSLYRGDEWQGLLHSADKAMAVDIIRAYGMNREVICFRDAPFEKYINDDKYDFHYLWGKLKYNSNARVEVDIHKIAEVPDDVTFDTIDILSEERFYELVAMALGTK